MIIIAYGFGISGLKQHQVNFLKRQNRLTVDTIGDGYAVTVTTTRKEFDEEFDTVSPLSEVINGLREYIFMIQDDAGIIRIEPEYVIYRKNPEIVEESENDHTEEPGGAKSEPSNTGVPGPSEPEKPAKS